MHKHVKMLLSPLSPYCLFALVLYCAVVADAYLDPMMISPQVADSYCPTNMHTSHALLYFYAHRFGLLSNATYDATTQKINVTYPLSLSQTYYYESTRRMNSSFCQHCPYDQDGSLLTEAFMGGGVRNLPTPMFGPCLDGTSSKKMACVQNVLLYPLDFVGEYFYPTQEINPALVIPTFKYNEHLFVGDSSPSAGTEPSTYGLGKKNVQAILRNMYIKNLTSGLKDENASRDVFGLYYDQESSEGWLRYAQHFCTFYCHRDSEVQTICVRPTDYLQKPTWRLLHRIDAGNTQSGCVTTMTKCNRCPRGNAAYTWNSIKGGDMRMENYSSSQCYPWFGGLPQLKPSTLAMNFTAVSHVGDVDSVMSPTTSYYIETLPCDVNYYNDVCAHTIQQYARWAADTSLSDALRANYSAKAQCKPCPPGYHTDGNKGAWYCLPPRGQRLYYGYHLLQTSSDLWSRRDFLGLEFECGYRSSHCRQCAAFGMAPASVPDDFNQAHILKYLLAVVGCEATYYCPHPLGDRIKCPSTKPWSPPNSGFEANCTCAAGTFLDATTHTCVACTAPTGCDAGKYRKGHYDCMNRNGMVSGGECTSCATLPANADYTTQHQNIEVLIASSKQVRPVCAFQCWPGFRLSWTTTETACNQTYTCEDMTAPIVSGAQQYYYANFERDEFTVNDPNSNTLCSVNALFKNKYAQMPGSLASPVSVDCTLANASFCNTPCYVTQEADYHRDFRCARCTEPPPGAVFTQAAKWQKTDVAKRSEMCRAECNTSFFLSSITRQCESCALAALSVCGPHEVLRGNGCYGNSTPFPSTTGPTKGFCVSCNISMENLPSGFYIELGVTCQKTECAQRPDTKFWKEPCQGFSAGRLEMCTGTCRPMQFKTAACTEAADIVCQNCTTEKKGAYRKGECGTTTDAMWESCPLGAYCTGNGAWIACPQGKTTAQKGAEALSDCICLPGTDENAQDSSRCVPHVCADSVPSTVAPGAGLHSSQYMDWDPASFQTKCYNCSPGGMVLGTERVGPRACVCPPLFFGYFAQNDSMMMECRACPSSLSCLGNRMVPPACWKGTLQSTLGIPACECALPPFTVASSTSCAVTGCEAAFVSVQGEEGQPQQKVTGSAVWATSQTWEWFAPSYGEGISNSNIQHMALTQEETAAAAAAASYPFLFWTIADPAVSLRVFFSSPSLFSSSGLLSYTGNSWSLMCNPSTNHALQALAVSKLQPYPPPSSNENDRVAVVAAVVFDQSKLWLYLNFFQVLSSQQMEGSWYNTNCNAPNKKDMETADAAVGLQHLAMFPGTLQATSTVYVAFASRVTAVNTDDSSSTATLHLGQRQLTSMVVLADTRGASLYLSFAGSASSIFRVRWLDASMTAWDSGSPELFAPLGRTIRLISHTWSAQQPILWALVGNNTSWKTIYTADLYQRTFTEVQGLPAFSQTQTAAVGAWSISTTEGRLLVANDAHVFTIPIGKCLHGQYYSGGQQCLKHVCMRQRRCEVSLYEVWDESSMTCACQPGYHRPQTGAVCTVCPQHSYCGGYGSPSVSCPVSLVTQGTGAVSVNECKCAVGSGMRDGQCKQCEAGFWCPNQWDMVSCPPHSEGVVGSVFPTRCACAVGFTDLDCHACPAGFYCPSGTTATNRAWILTVATITDGACSELQVFMQKFLSQSTEKWSFACYLLPASFSNKTRPMISLVVQAETSSSIISSLDAVAEMLENYNNTQPRYFSFVITQPITSSSAYIIATNKPSTCSKGFSPLADGVKCECAAGYYDKGMGCASCSPGYYKAKTGPGVCAPCDVGFTSTAAAAACTSTNPNAAGTNNNNTTGGGGATNIAAIAGGVVGGVALVGGILFAANYFYA